MKKNFLLVILLLVICACSQDTATIKESTKTFVTYPFFDPDPVPNPGEDPYPYFKFNGFSQHPDSVKWKVVTLENQYIEVDIFPEIGGKIWGAIEKSTGNEFIYYNSVVKFRDIAMRGPWTSGGIELNFGVIGHAPTTATPVDYAIRKNGDGSVSCFVGAIDLLTRARWETEVNLQPDKAYFTTNTQWVNLGPVLQPYYQWSNSAVQAEGDLELAFPGHYRIGHGGEANSWPADEEGRDLSFYRNNDFGGSKSYHIVGDVQGFYAAYWHDLDFGSGHYSLYGDKLGEKIFMWSQSRQGEIWEDLLTDTDGQYVELQSGRLFNQAGTSSTYTPYKHFGFSPHAHDTFKEYWFPVMDIGGCVKANSLGALNVERQKGGQTVYFSPLQPVRGKIDIYFGDELQSRFEVDLKPLEVWKKEIPNNKKEEPLRILVGADKELIYTENKESTISSRPVEAPENFDWNSVYGLFLSGINSVYQGNFDRAFERFRACLEKDPLYAPALNHLAELYLRKSGYETALEYVKKSLSINTYDPKANFIFGLASRKTGNLTNAQDGFAVASLSPAYREPACIELAKLFVLKDELKLAKQYVDRIIEKDNNNQEALLLSAIIARKNGREKAAEKDIMKMEALSPLNHFARFEKMLLKGDKYSENNFVSLIRNELSHETFLEMALWYEYTGGDQEAASLLETSPAITMADLHLSYLYDTLGKPEKSDSCFNKILQHSSDFVFPFRPESVPVLEWAVEKTDDWKPKYYLGLLHWHLGNKQLAKDYFSRCGEEPESPYFYLAKANLFRDEPGYAPKGDLTKACNLGSGDWRTFLALTDYYLEQGQAKEALDIAKETMDKFPENDILKYTHAKCLLANGLYSESLNELENTVVLPHEGARYGRVTYRLAAVMEGLQYMNKREYFQAIKSIEKARLWPETLGAGRPYEIDERVEDFLEAECLLKLNKKENANELYNKIIAWTEEQEGKNNSTDFLYLVVLKRLGRNKQAGRFLESWEQASPGDHILEWVRAMLDNNVQAARKTEQKINTKAGGTPWDPKYANTEFQLIKEISLNIR